MDDIVDEWNTRALIQKAKDDEENNEISGPSCSSKFTCLSYKSFNYFRPIKQLGWRRDIALRIRDINEKMNLIFLEIENLDLLQKVLETNVTSETRDTIDRTTTSSIKESQIHGRDNDQKILLRKVLLKDNNMLVIPIVGAGGLGKTTLAQLVYNNEEVRKRFDERIWVCVSFPFDEVKVARGILEGMKVGHQGMTHLQTLHESIKDSVCGKKILLVLDDVWEENPAKWERLRMCLDCGAPESRIMVTTRSEEVATKMSLKTTDIFKPPFISTSDCWLLMCEAAFQGKGDKDIAQLEDIGKRIANKCKGLPLAAKVLGSLLWSKDSREEWEQVLKSEIWSLENVKMELFPHIFLSYKELSSPLKRFFSFCALFPKDHQFLDEFLISYWMAQIPLYSRILEEDMMLTGKQYIKILKSRAFLEGGSYLDFHSVKMHDIMHDFALYLSGHEFLSLTEVNNNDNKEAQAYVDMKIRHLFVSGKVNPTAFCDVRKLHSCHAFGLEEDIALDLFKQLKFVRTLNLQRCSIKEVPESIGKLIHLRTLELSCNYELCRLPEATGELYNLQYIWLDGVPSSPSLLPKSLGKLINLQRLDNFVVEMGKSCLATLRNLNKLGGTLCIEFTSDYADGTDAGDAKLSNKKHITQVNFDFHYFKVTNGVLEALEPPPGVQILSIRGFNGETFLPDWITSLSYLKELVLSYAPNAVSIPPLGKLPSLEKLRLLRFPVLKFIGQEFLGISDNTNKKHVGVAFPKLLILRLDYCHGLEEWEDIEAHDEDTITVMPKLQDLYIDCPKLKQLPHRLISKATSLEKLTFNFNIPSLSFNVVGSSLQQPPHLRLLGIYNFTGSSIPNWMLLSLRNLTQIEITDASNLEDLPVLGKFACLEVLTLKSLTSLQFIRRDFLGIDNDNKEPFDVFPKLLTFTLRLCNKLSEWEDIEAETDDTITVLPKLECLIIEHCNRLQVLPHRLLCKAPRLKKLVINSCELLEESIKEDQQLMLHIEETLIR